MISIVSPVYRAEKILPTLVAEINAVMSKIGEDFEIILVDDRSPDHSWEVMKELSSQNINLKIYRLSRNFGQHATIMAGLTKTIGGWVVVMDCDMQDQPKEIEKLFDKSQDGFDVVLARREVRVDSKFKKWSSKMFYKLFNYLAGIEINSEIANFGIYKRKVIDSVLKIQDNIKFFPLFVNWVGYKSAHVAVEHGVRNEGKSSYSFANLISLAFNVIVSFSDKPLKIFVGLGAFISLFAIFMGVYFTVGYLLGNFEFSGFSSVLISIWFLSGIIISCIGIVGIYLGKTFNQTKNRPVFIIDEEM